MILQVFRNPGKRDAAVSLIASILFLTIVPLTAHLLFSSLGYNPTDDGGTLANTRRLLDGQVPHRDFITLRPVLSPALHLPFVLWGGEYTYWVSRLFVWFQFACCAWIWIGILDRRILGRSLGIWAKVSLALICFAVSAHTFPIMAWRTIDGLFLISLALPLITTEHSTKKLAGYFLVGAATLCKQNFLLAAPVILLIQGDWRQLRYWLAAGASGVLYVAMLLLTHAMSDAFVQMTSQTGLLWHGFRAYLNREVLLGAVAGFLATFLMIGHPRIALPVRKAWGEMLGALVLSVLPLLVMCYNLVSGRGILQWSYALFGLLVGLTAYLSIGRPRQHSQQVRAVLLGLTMAWSASVSIGYNTPALAGGQLAATLVAFAHPQVLWKPRPGLYTVTVVALAGLVLASFGVARTHYIYRDQPASNLTQELGGVFPGASRIRTNTNTYRFLVDLQKAIGMAQGLASTYGVIPDCAGLWVQSPQPNPIPIDWAQGVRENEKLINRVANELESIRDHNIVIVQKVHANQLANGFVPLSDWYALVRYVREQFTKVGETEFFELYR